MLKKTQKYTLVGSAASLVQQLERAQREDKQAEGKSRTSCMAGCLGALVCWLGSAALLPHDVAGPAILVGAGLSLVGGYRSSQRWSQHDLDDEKLAVAKGLLEILGVDLRDNVQAQLTLDFREPLQAPFFTGSQGSKRLYRQTWLELTAVLADSTKLALRVTRRGRYRFKPKRRGPDKILHARADSIQITLRVDPARYPDLSGVDLGQPPKDLKSGAFRASQNRLAVAVRTPLANHDTVRGIADTPERLANPNRILGALAWAYRGMKVAKSSNFL